MGCHRSEYVSTVKSRALLGQEVTLGAQFHGAFETGPVRGHPKNPVVRSDQPGAGARFDRDCTPLGADSGIHDHEENRPCGEISPAFSQRQSARQYILGRNPMSYIDDRGLRRDRRDHPAHHAGVVVPVAKIAEQGDRSIGAKRASNRPSRHPHPAVKSLVQSLQANVIAVTGQTSAGSKPS